MKFISYNILNGGEERLAGIVELVSSLKPDILVINEANGFEKNNNEITKQLSVALSMPYYELAHSGEYDYHVALFSRIPFLDSIKITSLKRAGIRATIEYKGRKYFLVGTHLSPTNETDRLKEITRILNTCTALPTIIMGDLNALSQHDAYDSLFINKLSQSQQKKFMIGHKLQTNVTSFLEQNGFVDVGNYKNNFHPTVPTQNNVDKDHMAPMRLDYFFCSQSIIKQIRSYSVIDTVQSNLLSDHFPICLEIHSI